MELNSPRTIWVRAPNWLGDLVMTTPGLRALRSRFPDAHITVQVRPGLEGILDDCAHLDAIAPVRSYHQGAIAMLREGRELRRRVDIDLAICIPESFSSAWLLRSAGAKCVVGYAGGVRAPLLHRRVPVPPSWGARRMVSRERYVLGLMEAVGCKESGTHLELVTSPRDDRSVEGMLAQAPGATESPVVILAPGASYGASKRWPASSFAQVADALSARGGRVVLIGTAAEAALTETVSRAMRASAIDLAGKLSLGELKSLVKHASLLVGNDAGARHLAAAFDVPSIVFFGPTSVAKTNLNLENVQVLETGDACRPCYRRDCPIDHRCMTGITASRVSEIAIATLGLQP